MHTQINLVQDSLGWKQLESILEPAIGQCVTSDLNNFLNGRQIIFGNGERRLVPIEGWESKNRHGNTPLMTIQPLKEETTIIAVDSSSIQIAETEEGALYALKSGITTAIQGQILAHFKMGPILFYLSEDTLRHSEIDHRIAKLVLLDSESAKKLIRIRVERAIQLELSHHFSGSILLVDGSLRSSVFEHRKHTLKKIVENCSLYKNTIVGLSKSTKIRILNKISHPLTKIKCPGFMDVDLIIKSLARNTIGDSLLVKFGNSYTSPILRADIATADGDRDRSLRKILGNDSIARGYPETLQLAHHISTFTSTEIVCLKSHVLNKYDVIELESEDIRKKLLGSIPL
ncbi:MAG: DNA double-strand break repair nuclease NurA [Nitrososphaeraceae archaeon]